MKVIITLNSPHYILHESVPSMSLQVERILMIYLQIVLSHHLLHLLIFSAKIQRLFHLIALVRGFGLTSILTIFRYSQGFYFFFWKSYICYWSCRSLHDLGISSIILGRRIKGGRSRKLCYLHELFNLSSYLKLLSQVAMTLQFRWLNLSAQQGLQHKK